MATHPEDPTSVPSGTPSPSEGPTWFEKETVSLLKRSLDDGSVDRKDLIRTVRDTAKLAEQSAGERHKELLRAIKGDPKPPPAYPLARVGNWIEKRPAYIQNAFALGGVLICLQIVGALYEKVTGHPPPQVTVPTTVTSILPSAISRCCGTSRASKPTVTHGSSSSATRTAPKA